MHEGKKEHNKVTLCSLLCTLKDFHRRCWYAVCVTSLCDTPSLCLVHTVNNCINRKSNKTHFEQSIIYSWYIELIDTVQFGISISIEIRVFLFVDML